MPKDNNILTIKMDELITALTGEELAFPKYTTQIMNLANQNAQGTRPKVVGQMSELIQECPYNDYKEWGEWYMDKMPNAIDDATERIMAMINNLKDAIVQIDEAMVRNWVKDLIVTKTFVGLKVQQGILYTISQHTKKPYRLANPDEESQGIDGFVGNTPISIKPLSYKTKDMLREKIDVKIVYYEKTKDAIKIHIHDLIEGKYF